MSVENGKVCGMNENNNYGFGIKFYTHVQGVWSFGSGIAHYFGETYLFISFAKWSVSIGWLMKKEADNEQ